MIHTLERFLEWGGVKKAVTCLVFSGIALLVSIFDLLPQLPFDAAWAAVVLCGIPIILEAVIGLVTAFDIKADVLVSIALIASLIIGEDFAAGEVAFIMQLGWTSPPGRLSWKLKKRSIRRIRRNIPR